MKRRRLRPPSTRDRILEQLKTALRDTLTTPTAPHVCVCDDCRAARAKDITPNPRILQVQPHDFERMHALAEARGLSDPQLTVLTLRMFSKVPVLLREIEAAAIIGHLERGDI